MSADLTESMLPAALWLQQRNGEESRSERKRLRKHAQPDGVAAAILLWRTTASSKAVCGQLVQC